MWIKFLLCIQLYQDQNIVVSSFVTVDKYQQFENYINKNKI